MLFTYIFLTSSSFSNIVLVLSYLQEIGGMVSITFDNLENTQVSNTH